MTVRWQEDGGGNDVSEAYITSTLRKEPQNVKLDAALTEIPRPANRPFSFVIWLWQ
jgi:hypothetical protein